MLEVKGFKGYRFSKERVESFDDVITPPFDVISPDQREELAARSAFNTVHLILPNSNGVTDKYEAAALKLEKWISEGVQQQDSRESYYLLEQQFVDKEGVERRRHGFFAVTKIPEAGENTVLGHEKTFRNKIEDRLALTRATRANLGPIFVMYSDPEDELGWFLAQMNDRVPDVVARTIDGVTLKLWRVDTDDRVGEFFKARKLYIADGHHRFATACAYRDEQRSVHGEDTRASYDYVLMGLVAIEDPGLLVYPAHRLVDVPEGFSLPEFLEKLTPYFDVQPFDADLARAVEEHEGCVLGLVAENDGQYLLILKDIDRAEFLGTEHGPAWRELDVAILHRGILEGILHVLPSTEFVYEPDAEKALAFRRENPSSLAFLMKGATPEQVCACADNAEFMPQKATYLFPKLPTGAVFHLLR